MFHDKAVEWLSTVTVPSVDIGPFLKKQLDCGRVWCFDRRKMQHCRRRVSLLLSNVGSVLEKDLGQLTVAVLHSMVQWGSVGVLDLCIHVFVAAVFKQEIHDINVTANTGSMYR